MARSIPVLLGVYGVSNTGKTTLLEQLISTLSYKGYHVATIKQSEHPDISMDTPGKDTWRHTQAGSTATILSTKQETDIVIKQGLETPEMIDLLTLFFNFDVILIEGVTDPDVPKVRIGEIEVRPNTLFDYQDDSTPIVAYVEEMHEKPITLETTINVDGKKIPLSEFPSDIISNGILGMLSTLKGVDTIQKANITIKQ